MNELVVDLDQLARCRTELSTLVGKGADIAGEAHEAGPHDGVWGPFIGQVFEPASSAQIETVHGHLQLMQDSLQSKVDVLAVTRTSYRDTDLLLAKVFTLLGRLLRRNGD